MLILKIIFWILLFIIVYTYVGYGILLYLIIKIRRFFKIGKKQIPNPKKQIPSSKFRKTNSKKQVPNSKKLKTKK